MTCISEITGWYTPVLPAAGKPKTGRKFFLNFYPLKVSDLPKHRKQHGYYALNFAPSRWFREGNCVVAQRLPDYEIAQIKIGQYIPEKGRIWEGGFYFGK